MQQSLPSPTLRSLRRTWRAIGQPPRHFQTQAPTTSWETRRSILPSNHNRSIATAIATNTNLWNRHSRPPWRCEKPSLLQWRSQSTNNHETVQPEMTKAERGPLGRPVMTEERLQQLLRLVGSSSSSSHQPASPAVTDDTSNTTNTTTTSLIHGWADMVRWSGDASDAVQFQSHSPKQVWNQARTRFGLEPTQYRHRVLDLETTNTPNPSKHRHEVTALTILPNPASSTTTAATPTSLCDCYETLRAHQHVGSHPEYDWIELVAVGMAGTKQQASQLAALDAIQLWKEATGIDLTLPSESWPVVSEMEGVTDETTNKSTNTLDDSKDSLEASYSKTQALLGLLGCSPIRYDYDHHPNHNSNSNASQPSFWTADAETFWRGTYYFSNGMRNDNPTATIEVPVFCARSKKEAEKHAMVGLLEQNQDTPLGRAADAYRALLESAPHIAGLKVPRWKNSLARELEASLATWEGREPMDTVQNKNESGISNGSSSIPNGQETSETTTRSIKPIASAATSATLWNREQAKIQRYSKDHPDTFQSIQENRKSLPIATLRPSLTDALQTSNIVLIQAGTGSGKSTQIPQYLLEDALASERASNTRILVTQPRRIAAKSLAERVAFERFEGHSTSMKDRSVGYSVRFDSNKPRKEGGTIEYITTGILLRRLLDGNNSKGLEGISHVLIDEVHERDLHTDLLLILMKNLHQQQQQHGIEANVPKLILLSATLDTTALTDYFAPVAFGNDFPVLSLSAKPLHPVKTWYLEDVLNDAQDFSPQLQELALSLLRHNDQVIQEELVELQNNSEGETDNNNRISVLERALSVRKSHTEALPASSEEKNTSLALLTPSKLRSCMVGLVSELALHLSLIETAHASNHKKHGGCILCFLPGMDDIKECTNYLKENCPETLRNKITVLPLHSEIPHHEQAKVFRPSRAGTVKVILSTNISESSLTIDDVLAVIDSGLVKESSYDAGSSMTTMETTMASRASSIQRLGRVGRIGPGTCYRLYSRGDFEAMEDRATPEIQKTNLQGTCLQVCSLLKGTNHGFDSVEDFLASAMDPPREEFVSVALGELGSLGAITAPKNAPENLTVLGECLVRLPLDPSIGKMLVMGTVMNCLGPLLTAAAWFGERQMVFSHPIPRLRAEARESQRSFSNISDIEGIVCAYDRFWQVQTKKGWKAAKDWAREHYVNPAAMTSMRAVRRQLLHELCMVGLVEQTDVLGGDLRPGAAVDQHGDCQLLVGALWCTAVPQNLAARNKMGRFGTLTTAFEDTARLHPSSVLFHRKPPQDPPSETRDGDDAFVVLPPPKDWYTYRRKVQTTNVFLHGCSAVLPEQILMFGGSHLDTTGPIVSQNQNIRGILDGWIAIQQSSCVEHEHKHDGEETVDLLFRAREAIDAILERKLLDRCVSEGAPSHAHHHQHDLVFVDAIRKFFDDLETCRIPEAEPRTPSNDFHDYFLVDGEAEDY